MRLPRLTDAVVRRCHLTVVVLALASIPLAPLNALARMRTVEGREDLAIPIVAAWAEPALDLLHPWLLDFADPETVYTTYGKFYLLAVLAVLACAVGTWSRRPVPRGWAERWGWRLTTTGYAVLATGHLTAYWLLQVDGGFLVVLLGLLVGIPGHVLLGVALVRSGFRPRLAAWVLLLDLPLMIALSAVSTMALAMWPMMLAWGLVGWARLHRDGPAYRRTPLEDRLATGAGSAPTR